MEFDALQDRVHRFMADRDWERFNTPKNLSMALSVEVGELQELFMWHDNLSVDRIRAEEELMQAVRDEMADVFITLLELADRLDVDLLAAAETKLDETEEKYDEPRTRSLNAELDRFLRDRPLEDDA